MAPKIVFMGTPEIAVPTLELLHSRLGVTAVVTVPDKPQGRGLHFAASPVKAAALQLGLPVLQPASLSNTEFVAYLQQLAPDLIVVFAFRFLPRLVYDLASVASFNIHTSLLPDYRGAAPINWAIINGETTTGLTAFVLNNEIDGGPIISQHKVLIPPNCTAGGLYGLLSAAAPGFAVNVCQQLLAGSYELHTQTGVTSAKLAPKLDKDMARIDWRYSAAAVVNFINGYSPKPCAWTVWPSGRLQVLHAKLWEEPALAKATFDAGDLLQAGNWCVLRKSIVVRCGDGNVVELLQIKPENKKAMLTADFINGYKGAVNGKFEID